MRIQHNIMAMNAYRNYNLNNKALSGNLEKLSSGYKINRAGDDAAGLAISEKMRAQITGLNAAQKNVKDGISLVKTAEGAMQEIQDMLNRMDYLATQSANGTYDNEVDRANLQKEVENLKTEINRIADSANFNGIKLLDGSLDANAKAVTETVTTTTGGKTDVSILQEVATDPTAEVGTKTVLRGEVAEKGKAEINIALHDLTLKGNNGDSFKVTVGDATIELTVGATEDKSKGQLKADTSYSGKKLADMIKGAFDQTAQQIGGQTFKATASADGVKFEQVAEPTSASEVVDTANVAVKVEHVANPTGTASEYTVDLADKTIKTGDKLYIGDYEYTMTSDQLSSDFGTEKAVGDYKVKYENGRLTIKDPDGTNGKPEVSYDSYGDAVKVEANKTAGADAVKAQYSVKVTAGGGYSGAEKAQYSIKISGYSGLVTSGTTTIEAGGKTLTVGTDISKADVTDATKLAQAVAAKWATDTNYTVRAENGTLTFTAKSAGVDTNKASVIDAFAVTVGGATSALTAGTAETIDAGKAADTIKVGGQTITVGDVTDVTAGTITAADANDSKKLAAFLAQTFQVAGVSNYNVSSDGDKIVYTATAAGKLGSTGAPAAAPADLLNTGSTQDGDLTFGAMTNDVLGTDATTAYTEYDLSGLKEGDIVTVTNADGTTTDFKVGAGGQLGLTDTDVTGSDAFGATVSAASGVAAASPVSLNGNTLKITAAAGGAKPNPIVGIKVKTKESTTAELKDVAKDPAMTGTWNVQSTNSKNGGYGAPSPLASTAFDLTSDIVKDGNVLTIGEGKYVFKVGADSQVTAKAGETLIDLSNYEADNANLINAAGAALANQTGSNSAFSIGYEKDSNQITIHENLGQTVYDKELMSVEEFDKLVYVEAPEVTTSEEVTTGKDGKPLTLQIGDTSESFNQMQVSVGDMHTKAMGTGEYVDENGETVKVEKTIADVDIGNQEGAAEAVQVIKNAINYVSSVRGDLGAIQNRLDHTANNLSVMAENIQDAESTIRDTDVAEEMMSYVKNNILVQSAQAMLAQANQVPQGVLQLLG